MSYYRYHVFFCVNQRAAGETCCANHQAQAVRDYAKQRIKSLGMAGPGGIRINTAGCLARCEEGPVMVIYPEGTWYTYVDQHDIDEIIEQHLQHGRIVERLKMKG
ncbi:MAG: (2Fe-2S) ferredoxin domain-containing protein [Sulfuricaulis sp.]